MNASISKTKKAEILVANGFSVADADQYDVFIGLDDRLDTDRYVCAVLAATQIGPTSPPHRHMSTQERMKVMQRHRGDLC